MESESKGFGATSRDQDARPQGQAGVGATGSDGPDRPSRHGAILGAALSQLAEAGARAVGDDVWPLACATCAFRPGTVPNQSAGTGLIAFKCAIGVDPDPFGCHHGLHDGSPTKPCAGFVAARLAPYGLVKEVSERVARAVTECAGPDQIRAAYDAWLADADPNGEMDVYQIARAWLRDHPQASPEPSNGRAEAGTP